MDFLSIVFWLWDGGSEISLKVFMQMTEVGIVFQTGGLQKCSDSSETATLALCSHQVDERCSTESGYRGTLRWYLNLNFFACKICHMTWFAHVSPLSSSRKSWFPCLHSYHVFHEYPLLLLCIFIPSPWGTTWSVCVCMCVCELGIVLMTMEEEGKKIHLTHWVMLQI